jgi:hypothetical protein
LPRSYARRPTACCRQSQTLNEMAISSAAQNSALVRVLRFVDRAERFPRLVRVTFWALMAVAAAGMLLDHGAWTRSETFPGPFRPKAESPDLYTVDIGVRVPFWLGIRLVDTDPAGGNALASPRLLLDGYEIALPQTPRAEIFRGAAYRLGSRQRELLFPLPEGVSNDRRLALSVTYAVRLHNTFYDIARWGFGLVLLLRLVLARRSVDRMLTQLADAAPRWAPGLFALFPIVSVVAIAACAGYTATIVYGIYAGHALPTATVFRLLSPDLLGGIEPYAPPAILIFAATGTGLAWAASFRIVPVDSYQRMERLLGRIWGWSGLPVILCLMLFSLSAGGWSGNIRPQDQNYVSLAGLIPHSDARAFFTDVYRQAFWGEWDVLGSRRPLGEAFRELTVFAARYSYVGTLLVQLGLLAGALFLSARAVARGYGIWAAIAFVGFIYITTRSFLYTTMSEPLALIWALFSIVFLVEAFRFNSLPHALIGLAGLSFALAIRLGSVLTIPLLMLWLAISFASGLRARCCAFTLACGVVVGLVVLNGLLGWLYAAPNVDTGANFAWTACGLSLGTDWTGCREAYEPELRLLPHERAAAIFLFAKTWENISASPLVFLAALGGNFWEYTRKLPQFLFEGYTPSYRVPLRFAQCSVLVLLTCLFLVRRRQSSRTEWLFWICLFISVFLSAAVVLGGDGWRVLHVTHALIAWFFAAGFTAPAVVVAGTTPSWRWQTGVAIIAAMTALFVVVPALSHALAREFAIRSAIGSRPDEHIVLGGRHLAGFLVIPDHEALPLQVPALHLSRFIELFRFSHWESDFGPIRAGTLPTRPFSFVMGVGPSGVFGGNLYLAPPAVLQLQQICTWKFTVRSRRSEAPTSLIFFEVTAAEEWQGAGHNGRLCPL